MSDDDDMRMGMGMGMREPHPPNRRRSDACDGRDQRRHAPAQPYVSSASGATRSQLALLPNTTTLKAYARAGQVENPVSVLVSATGFPHGKWTRHLFGEERYYLGSGSLWWCGPWAVL